MSGTKCETARHDQMPADCSNARHEHCDSCGRCYTCESERQAEELRRQSQDAWEG